MKLRLEDKNKAIELRKQGLTYNEIRQTIPNISKGTLSGWLKNIELEPYQKKRILKKIKDGSDYSRLKGAWSNKVKAEKRIKLIKLEAKQEFDSLMKDSLFPVGLCLYWAEGAKTSRSFQFINSDSTMIRIIMKWLRETLKINENEIKIKLYIHKIYDNEDCEKFWSGITKIDREKFLKTVYKLTIHKVKKNISYKGCCRIELKGSNTYWKITQWQQMFIDYMDNKDKMPL